MLLSRQFSFGVRAVGIVLLLSVASCVSAPSGAVINDLGKGHYGIVSVDGREPRRWRHSVVSVVPYVLVDAGSRRLELRRNQFEGLEFPEQLFVDAVVEEGGRYRLHWNGSSIDIVADPSR